MRGAAHEEQGSDDYVIRVFDDPLQIDAAAWDALVESQPSATPFVRHAYLAALHASGSATEASGWLPQFLALFEAGRLVALRKQQPAEIDKRSGGIRGCPRCAATSGQQLTSNHQDRAQGTGQ